MVAQSGGMGLAGVGCTAIRMVIWAIYRYVHRNSDYPRHFQLGVNSCLTSYVSLGIASYFDFPNYPEPHYRCFFACPRSPLKWGESRKSVSNIQRASPNLAIALGFYCCIGASACVPTCFVVERAVDCWSCTMFLDPLLGSCCFLDDSVAVVKKLPERSPNPANQKMFPEVVPELHGEPLVPKMPLG